MLHSHVTEVSRSTFTDTVIVEKLKRANDDKDYAECIDSKIIKNNKTSEWIRTIDLLFKKQEEKPLCYRAVLKRRNIRETFDSDRV